MASADMSLASEHVQRLLQCAVCLERFTQPKLLPCQHTFCLRPCLEGLVDHRTRSLRCPECRADHFVPRNGVSSYPNNLTVIGFLELSEPVARAADEAEDEEAEASWRPQAGPGAPEHTRGHQPQRAASPPAVPVDAAGANGGGCFVCHAEGRIVRCCHCDLLVCDACHRLHSSQIKAELTRMISQIRRGLPSITDQILVVGRRGTQLQNNCERARADVTEAIEKHIRELKARERTLREDIDNFLSGELRAIRTHQENAEVEMASLASFCDAAEYFLSLNRPRPTEDLMDMRRQCRENLETVHCYEDGTIQPPNVKHIEASLESPFLSSTIGSFGDLIVTSRSNQIVRMPQQTSAIDTREEAGERFNRGGSRQVAPRTSLSQQQLSTDSGDEAEERLNRGGGRQVAPRTSLSQHQLNTDSGEEAEERFPRIRGRETAVRASMPPPRLQPHREESGLSTMVSGLSPRTNRARSITVGVGSPRSGRSRRQGSPTRTPQVMFAEDSPPREEPRSSVGRHRGHRRSREERYSDTHLPSLLGGRGATSSIRRSQDRSRHLSLGALPMTAEVSDDETTPDREDDEPAHQHPQRRFDRRSDTDSPAQTELSSTYPGARPWNTVPPPNRFDIGLSDSDDRSTDSPGLYAEARAPTVYASNTPINKYNQKGTALLTFGHRGSEARCFTWPRGVAVSPLTDNIFVADSSNHRVQVFENTGRYLQSFGHYGQGDGEFDCLAGVAVNGLGQIIVADRYNHRIQILDRNGNFSHSFGREGSALGQLNYPWGIACDNMGFIYVCDKENHRVQVFQSNGTFVRTFGHLGNGEGEFENPHYIASSCDNKIYVSDSSNHRIQVFSMYGDFLFSFGSSGSLRGQMKFPRGIAVDSQGFVVVADSGNNRVQVFRGDGRFYTMFGNWGCESGNFKGLEGLAILNNGNIVVSDRENHRIQVF